MTGVTSPRRRAALSFAPQWLLPLNTATEQPCRSAPRKFIASVAVTKNALGNLKQIAELVQKYKDLDMMKRIVVLQTEVFALQADNLELKQRLAQREKVRQRGARRGNSSHRFPASHPRGRAGSGIMSFRDHGRPPAPPHLRATKRTARRVGIQVSVPRGAQRMP